MSTQNNGSQYYGMWDLPVEYPTVFIPIAVYSITGLPTIPISANRPGQKVKIMGDKSSIGSDGFAKTGYGWIMTIGY